MARRSPKTSRPFNVSRENSRAIRGIDDRKPRTVTDVTIQELSKARRKAYTEKMSNTMYGKTLEKEHRRGVKSLRGKAWRKRTDRYNKNPLQRAAERASYGRDT